jgi:hypothetical protein
MRNVNPTCAYVIAYICAARSWPGSCRSINDRRLEALFSGVASLNSAEGPPNGISIYSWSFGDARDARDARDAGHLLQSPGAEGVGGVVEGSREAEAEGQRPKYPSSWIIEEKCRAFLSRPLGPSECICIWEIIRERQAE